MEGVSHCPSRWPVRGRGHLRVCVKACCACGKAYCAGWLGWFTSHGSPSSVCETAELHRNEMTAIARITCVEVLQASEIVRTSARHA